MLDIYYQISFISMMAMAVIGITIYIPLILIQHFIFKNIFDPIYFNIKHFNDYELSIYDSFPLFFMKTLAYIRAIVFPETMRKRFVKNILNPKERPIIYLLALFTIIMLTFAALVLINTAVVAVFILINK